MASFTAKDVVKILKLLGYLEKRQSGSHLILFHPKTKSIIPVPMHTKDLKKGLVRAIIKQANSSEQEFLRHR
jgi:predicted RNA binding protein YcfA (HicA-like mRNA interferase family)